MSQTPCKDVPLCKSEYFAQERRRAYDLRFPSVERKGV